MEYKTCDKCCYDILDDEGNIMEHECNMDDKINKVKEIFVRLGASDSIITKEQWENNFHPEDIELYLIGFEDEDGEECEEDGTYLNQEFVFDNDKKEWVKRIIN